MQRNLIVPFIALLLAAACKKDNSSPPSGTAGGGGGGQAGSAHISSWEPAIPYADDTITFHGTGFDPVASGNSITTCNHVLHVISASATQLKAHVVEDITTCIYYDDQSDVVFQANGWSDTLAAFHWKKVPRITEINTFSPYYCNALFRGGDSLEVLGIGFGPNSLASFAIAGHGINGPVQVDTGLAGYGYLRVHLLPADLGSSNDECDTATVLVTLTNTDGRVFSKQSRIGHGPHASFGNIVPNITSASRADMIANGLVIYATVNGQYLKTCMTVRLYDQSNLPILTMGGAPSGFPDSYTIGPIDPGTLAVGSYNFHPVDCDGVADLFHGGGFTLNP